MGSCLSDETKTQQLAEQLDSRIRYGSINDVKALLRRGAPVNGIPEQVNAICIMHQFFGLLQIHRYSTIITCVLGVSDAYDRY